MSISPWDELQELAADKYVALELDGSEWRLAEGDGYPLSSNRNRFEFLMWAQIRAIIEQVATLTAERDALLEDIKERDRTYLAVQKADGLEREKVEAERDALRTALQKIRTRHAVIDGKFDRTTVGEIDKALRKTDD